MPKSPPPRRHTRTEVPVRINPLTMFNGRCAALSLKQPLYYLASPISTKDPLLLWGRYEAASRALARLITAGHLCYSPMTHWMSAVATWHLPMNWAFWEPISRNFHQRCDAMIVLQLPGWEESKGVQTEISWGLASNMSIFTVPASGDPELASLYRK